MNGGTFWETLPISLTDIERIEIIRGPSTALYGPNAVSGVINIMTKKTLEENNLEVNASVQGGTEEYCYCQCFCWIQNQEFDFACQWKYG